MKPKLISSFIAPIALIVFAGQAWAYVECDTDADCIEGFVCITGGASSCAAEPCAEGEDCADRAPCEPEEFSFCVPGPCTSDDDCGEGLRCLEVEYGGDCYTWAVPDCGPGEDCPEGPDSGTECEEIVIETLCLPPYVAPCESDEECGDGFECVPDEVCTCSGGGSSGEVPPEDSEIPEDGFVPDDDGREWEEDVDCGCSPSGENYCSPREIECDGDEDCPDTWTCEEIPSVYACYIDESGEEHCDEPPIEEEPGLCMPPYFDDMGWGPGGGGDADIDGDTLEHATGHGNARPTGRAAGESFGGSNGCQTTPGASAGTAAVFWMLPLLIGLALRRRR